MSLRVGKRVFAPGAFGVLLAASLLGASVALGWWQLGRASEKQAMIDSFARGTQTSVVLEGELTVDGMPRFQHVTAEGRYDVARQILLDNMPSQSGRPGYRVLTPLIREGSERLLMVDRGWVPLGPTRADLPEVAVSPEPRRVAGRLDVLPQPGVRVGEAGVAGDTAWPRVLNFPRQQDLERALGAPVEARILLLDPAAPDGYERVWRPALGFGPERHLGYAIQWFALGLAVLVGFVALSLRPAGDDPAHTD